MSWYRAQIEFDRDSLAAADKTVWNWHYATDDAGAEAAELDDITDSIEQFVQVVDQYFSSEMTGTWRIKYYDMEDAPARVPIRTDTGTTFTPAASGLPSQLAIVVGLRGAPLSGVNPQRRRGRFYFGPVYANTTDDTGERTVDGTTLTQIGVAAATHHVTPVPGTASGSLIQSCIFSRRSAYDALGLPYSAPEPDYTVGALNAGFIEVASVNIGDLFGVQRRRRIARNPVRSTFT